MQWPLYIATCLRSNDCVIFAFHTNELDVQSPMSLEIYQQVPDVTICVDKKKNYKQTRSRRVVQNVFSTRIGG